jgi:hypothetical protein
MKADQLSLLHAPQSVPRLAHDARQYARRSLAVYCLQCHHRTVLAVDKWSDDVPVPSFGPRMVSTQCGTIGADARSNWAERQERPSLTGWQWR